MASDKFKDGQHKDLLASRYSKKQLSIYEKEFICKRLQPHYTIADLMEIYSVSRDTILRALQEENVKTHRIRRTILIPASEIPKIIKDV